MDDLNKKRRKIEFPNLLPPTQHFIHRLVKEFKSYVLTENDTKSELTICANPLLDITAPRAFTYMGYFEDNYIEDMCHRFVSDMVNKFAGKPHEPGAAFTRQAELPNTTDPTENHNDPTENNNNDEDDYGNDIFLAMAIQEAKKQQQLGTSQVSSILLQGILWQERNFGRSVRTHLMFMSAIVRTWLTLIGHQPFSSSPRNYL